MRFIVLLVLLAGSTALCQPYGDLHAPEWVTDDRAAGCSAANGKTFLEFNNVRALIHTGGNLWQITGQNFQVYEVPKGSGIHALFTSALWLGGVDINGQLKLAAVRYRQGQDYWTGPLSQDEAEITSAICQKYDRHFVVTQDEVREFDGWYNAGLNDIANGTNTQEEQYPDYEIPLSILEWPAHGDPALGQDYYLAPFYDRDGDGNYNPANGDYPWYDINKELDCSVDRTVTLYGDQTIWWVMNDKGNIHTESGSEPLGMEIRCQAFAFATNDEINNMTFYNYELVNRSTQTLYETYFGVFIDDALGNPNDDYVGCDVSRGLAYAYNGSDVDVDFGGWKGYGAHPPAVGIDFFEGPYEDDDGIDNPLVENYVEALSTNGIPYPGLGIGYGDGVVDNERLGMRRFLYYNNVGGGGNPAQTDPISGQDYYNYMTGFWKDNSPHVYGGTGHIASTGANPSVLSKYMFPGDTDPVGWGTNGIPQPLWTEESAGTPPYDRRFCQSAGPFILKPGAVNNITTGICWARAGEGDPFESVKVLQTADDKAQALFDNCFKILEGPHAPEISIQEMENELIFSLYNHPTSNNLDEDYEEVDPFIVNVDNNPNFDGKYHFQGYQVFQLRDEFVSPTELGDIEQARLVFQCDIVDTLAMLINYEFDDQLAASVPVVKVDGENKGIRHSFSVTEDQFATGDSRKLVNFKRYHYMAIAYAANNFKEYSPFDPELLDGQKFPYKPSRKAAVGEIIAVTGIPHSPRPENGGTDFFVPYGYEIPLTQIDGRGNAGRWTDISPGTEELILANNSVDEVSYEPGASPVKVQVIDPLNLPSAGFELYFEPDSDNEMDSASWYCVNTTTYDTVFSDHTIDFSSEQLIPEWGISITVAQTEYGQKASGYAFYFAEPIGATVTYADSSRMWLNGVPDDDEYYPTNWIRSGDFTPTIPDECTPGSLFNACYYPDKDKDFEFEYYEKLLDGTVAPFKLVGLEFKGMPHGYPDATYDADDMPSSWYSPISSQNQQSFADLRCVDLVITSDKSKWTRCPVIEACISSTLAEGGSSITKLRYANSVDQNGFAESGTGMGWFPGYAIDIESGQRLNMAFAENSWLHGSNGRDMIWNPTSEYADGTGEPILGGHHFVYIFGVNVDDSEMPAYDQGAWMHEKLADENAANFMKVWKSCLWVLEPMLAENHDLLETDVRIKLRVSHPYQEHTATGLNNGFPAYRFSTSNIATLTEQANTEVDALSMIRIVPNPYFAYSEYESGRLDTRVKITNLPETCTITIFNMRGGLVKRINKDNDQTFVDWTLKNDAGIPIAGGMYIFHIDVPGTGEKILKWYCGQRLVDTDNL
jgi:hypothetical protein